ncbi:MAG TPA: hypothetical protein VFN35_09635, partial [Ktedonobacteraceae bacterium]|nr:hypothetical protein [Ktedonobacteraceae bacterium]
ERVLQRTLLEEQATLPTRALQATQAPVSPGKLLHFPGNKKNRSRLTVLVAGFAALFLVGGLMGALLLNQHLKISASSTASPTQKISVDPTPQKSSDLLGRYLGPVALGMTVSEVQNLMGNGMSEKDMGKFALRYDELGLEISFSMSTGQAYQIVAWGSFSGATAEGCRLGVTPDQFSQIYQSFAQSQTTVTIGQEPFTIFSKFARAALIASDSQRTTLWALLDQEKKVSQFVLMAGAKKSFSTNQP